MSKRIVNVARLTVWIKRQTCPQSTVPHLVFFVGDEEETREGSVNGSKQEYRSLVKVDHWCGGEFRDGSDRERPRRHPILHRYLQNIKQTSIQSLFDRLSYYSTAWLFKGYKHHSDYPILHSHMQTLSKRQFNHSNFNLAPTATKLYKDRVNSIMIRWGKLLVEDILNATAVQFHFVKKNPRKDKHNRQWVSWRILLINRLTVSIAKSTNIGVATNDRTARRDIPHSPCLNAFDGQVNG